MSLDDEILEAERRLTVLYARLGVPYISPPRILRPEADWELSPNPVWGEETTFFYPYALRRSAYLKIHATGNFTFDIVGARGHSSSSCFNGYMRPSDGTEVHLIRLMAIVDGDDKRWVSTLLRGSWTIDS